MAPFYVFALSDAPVGPWRDPDGRSLESVQLDGVYAVGERRADRPAPTDEELARQHLIVVRIADSAPAVLPARFGSLLEDEELAAIVRQRAQVIDEALDRVRHNVQMTLRVPLPQPKTDGSVTGASTGREYLQRRRDSVSPPLPAEAVEAVAAVRGFVLEQRTAAPGSGIVAVYHLVRRADARDYRDVLRRVSTRALSVSGPWPPFAFGPELWA